MNHTRFPKEDHRPDWARWDNKVTKGDRVDLDTGDATPQSQNTVQAQGFTHKITFQT